jgi:hypothetical protein
MKTENITKLDSSAHKIKDGELLQSYSMLEKVGFYWFH